MYSRDLPAHEDLARYTPKTISRVYNVDGSIIDEFALERRLFVPAEDIPDLVKEAFISAEDKNFYEHKGYDLMGIASAVIDAAQGGRLRGASTITASSSAPCVEQAASTSREMEQSRCFLATDRFPQTVLFSKITRE